MLQPDRSGWTAITVAAEVRWCLEELSQIREFLKICLEQLEQLDHPKADRLYLLIESYLASADTILDDLGMWIDRSAQIPPDGLSLPLFRLFEPVVCRPTSCSPIDTRVTGLQWLSASDTTPNPGWFYSLEDGSTLITEGELAKDDGSNSGQDGHESSR